MKFSVSVAAAMLFAGNAGRACDLCAVYNASAARGEHKSGWHASLAQQFTRSGTLQENGEEIPNPIDQYRNSSVTSLLVGYNVTPRFGLSLNVPYIYRAFRRAEGFEVDRGSESGLGDIALLGRFNAVTTFEHDMSLSVSFFGGVEFPTGDTDRLREEVDEVEVPGAPESGVHGDDLALGSGSFDGIVGAAGTVSWKRWFLSVDAQYFIRTRGDFGYRFGSELAVSGGPGFYILFEEEMTLGLQANVNYETKARDHIAGEKKDEGILVSWYAGPGVVFTFGENFSATAYVDIPLTVVNQGVQVAPDYRIRGGVTWVF